MQKGLVFSLGTCPEAIMFTLVHSESSRDIVLPPTPPNLQLLHMVSSLLLREVEMEIQDINPWYSHWQIA